MFRTRVSVEDFLEKPMLPYSPSVAHTLCYDKGSEAITERGRRHGVGNEHEEKREINEAYPDMADLSLPCRDF